MIEEKSGTTTDMHGQKKNCYFQRFFDATKAAQTAKSVLSG